MATFSDEKSLISLFTQKYGSKMPTLVSELVIPIIEQFYYNNYLAGRKYVRIDLAALDKKTDSIIFIEAENGLYVQHPQIFLPFCNYLYILSNYDESPYRGKQVEWCKKEGIGIIELNKNGEFVETLPTKEHQIYPNVKAYVKARIIKRLRRSGRNA